VATTDDRIRTIKRSSVYGIFHDNDGIIYVGQTRQPLSRRLDAHRNNVRKGHGAPLYEHLRETQADLSELAIQPVPFTSEQIAIQVYGGLDRLLNAQAGSDVKPYTGYDWSSEEVDALEEASSISDAARRTGASWTQARRAMLKLDLIDPQSRDRIDWSRYEHLLGTMPDARLADRIDADVTYAAVAKRRRELNIEAYGQHRALTNQEAKEALQAYAHEDTTHAALADRFDVSESVVGKLIRGETYTEIDRPVGLA
jgi:hypothetical protein